MNRKLKTKLPKEFFAIERPSMSMEEALEDIICPFDEADLLKAKKKYERKKKIKEFFKLKKSN